MAEDTTISIHLGQFGINLAEHLPQRKSLLVDVDGEFIDSYLLRQRSFDMKWVVRGT